MAVLAILLLVSALMPEVAPAQTIQVARVQSGEPDGAAGSREFFGQVVALETVDLAFQVGGQVIDFPVREGAIVDEGALIAQLDLEPLQLALATAEAAETQANRTLSRLERLGPNTVSQASIDDARTSAEVAAIDAASARRSLEQGTLAAPFEALVSERLVANHTTIVAGTPVIRLHDMSEIHIEINVPEILFQTAGDDPDVELYARFPSSDRRYPVELREFTAETAAIGQTYTITLGMEPPDDLTVLPGSSVVIEARQNTVETALVVPRSALVFTGSGLPQVLLFEPAGASTGQLRLHSVRIEPSSTGAVRVIEGLTPDQEFISAGASQLHDGDTVRRFTGFGQ